MIFPINHQQPLSGNKVNLKRDEFFMRKAYQLAERAFTCNEVPVGAIIVSDEQIIGQGHNQPISQVDPTAHAEIVAIRQAALAIGNYRLVDTTLYVTLEPCIMCVGAMVHARIKRLIYAAPDPKTGAIQSKLCMLDHSFLNHRIDFSSGTMAAECSTLLSCFFKSKRVKAIQNS